MDWFKNMKIRNKLLLVYGLIMLMVVLLSIFDNYIIGRIEDRYELQTEGSQRRLTYASDAVGELSTIRRSILSIGYLSEDKVAVEEYYERYAKAADRFTANLNAYKESLMSDKLLDDNDKILRMSSIDEIELVFNREYILIVNEIYDTGLSDDNTNMDSLIMSCIPLGDTITEKLSMLRFISQKNAEEVLIETQKFTDFCKLLLNVMSFSAALLTLLVTMYMSNAIKKPIEEIGAAVEEVASGNLSCQVRSNYKDEVGILSNRIGDMIDIISNAESVREANERTQLMLDATPLCANFWNESYENVDCNQEAVRLFDLSCKDEYLERFLELSPEFQPCGRTSAEMSREFVVQAYTEGYCRFEWLHKKLNGEFIPAEITLVRVKYKGGYIVIGYTRDLRELKVTMEKMQEAVLTAEKASSAKSIFLANMSHEIRTPMNGIIGFSELALDDNIPSKTREYLSKIKESSESLLQIINDVLDISKIEAGKIELEHIPFDIHEVFRLCRVITTPKTLEKGISLFCYAEPSVGKLLLGDPTRLRQVLLNLLSNAVKFTNTGMVKLLSAITGVNENSITMHFEVKDSGIGMTAEQIDRVFEPFIQADDSTTRKYGGTGLGLSITKNIIELMGGKLFVESTQGVGSKFSFEITFDTIAAASGMLDKRRMEASIEKPTFNGEILVCEDNELNQQVISGHLEKVGLNCVIAVNGFEGVELVKNRMEKDMNPFDLIFMDIHMPIMDGLEAAKKLNQIGSNTPVVALTANIMANDREVYQSLGMRDCLSKPFSAHELWSCLLDYLTPVKVVAVDPDELSKTEENQRLMLLSGFVKEHRHTLSDIKAALDTGDIKLAHRIAHTLKGAAGLVGMTKLMEAAKSVEMMLAGGTNEVTHEQMESLSHELNASLAQFIPIIEKHDCNKANAALTHGDYLKAAELLNELDALLESDSFDCLTIVKDLEGIPGAKTLIDLVEKFDFRQAQTALCELKQDIIKLYK